jgi:CHASE3 domain sensor protein
MTLTRVPAPKAAPTARPAHRRSPDRNLAWPTQWTLSLLPAVKAVKAVNGAVKAGRASAGSHASGPAERVRQPTSTPMRVRALGIAVAMLIVVLAALLTVEVNRERTGLDIIGHKTAPVVTASSDLYFTLNDMDAQLANVLLVGDDTGLGFSRAEALKIYKERREQVSGALQRAASTAAADPDAAKAVRDILDALGRYETIAAQMILLDEQQSHPAGRPSEATVATYREATDLLESALLPAAQGLIDRNSEILDRTYNDQRERILTVRTWLMTIGLALLGALIVLQVYLARRYHRLINPALAVATVLAAGLAISGITLTSDGAEYLRVAKKDAFDSVLALNRARAISYDANADESRYLVDPKRAAQHEKEFLAKSQQLVTLPDATLATFDRRLDNAFRAYRHDNADVEWDGFYGKAFDNITFLGARPLAEKTFEAYRVYQIDDRRIRQLARAGRLREAIALCTSYNPGDSNYHFSEYDKALVAFTDLNERWFERSIADGESQLRGWTVIPAVAGLMMLSLLVLGLWRRLAEYH